MSGPFLAAVEQCTGASSNPWTDVIASLACIAALCFVIWLLIRYSN